jgi:predicted heme/steroid binding protein
MKSWTSQRRRFALTLLAAVVLAGAAGCGGSGQADGDGTTVSTGPGTTGKTFTLDELAQFDGADGAPSYVAVDGVIYDVTGSRAWPSGQHSRCDLGAMAGQDLSELITQAPANMRALLAGMPVVGTLSP